MLQLDATIEKLRDWFTGIDQSITAFSGGVDSTLVVFLSQHFLGEKAIACISDSPSLKRKDLQFAKDYCSEIGIRLEILQTKEIEDPNYFTNPVNRCFACKSHLYQDLSELQERFPDAVVLNGTNKDDFGDYRPGLQAASNHKVRSPLADCGLRKAEVRLLAKHFDLPNWDKPASPCLSSRIPYGNAVTREKLIQIEEAEEVLFALGFEEARVRHFGIEAKIEVPSEDIPKLQKLRDAIEPQFKQIGFETCVIDSEGFVSGKLNRTHLLDEQRA